MSSETFSYVDPIEGSCQVTIIRAADGTRIITKNGRFVSLDSPEAEPLLAQWARRKLGLT